MRIRIGDPRYVRVGVDVTGETVFDVGCGTDTLAIPAREAAGPYGTVAQTNRTVRQRTEDARPAC